MGADRSVHFSSVHLRRSVRVFSRIEQAILNHSQLSAHIDTHCSQLSAAVVRPKANDNVFCAI